MECVIEDLGLIEYEKAWKIQDKYVAEIAAGTRPPTLLLLTQSPDMDRVKQEIMSAFGEVFGYEMN